MSGLLPKAIKRIYNDMKDLNQDPLEKEGIYHYFNEDDISTAYIMIIGPQDTPYENGFYFFKFTFPSEYPFKPPSVKFCTLDGNVRFNPNLYTCGKVCLSLINTWDGPKWTSCQTIRSVLISLRGLVLGVKHPLQNEPGYESVEDIRSNQYNQIIHHENFRVAVVKMINETPTGFSYFKPIMVEYIKKNYIWYYKKLTELSKDNGLKVSSIYSMNISLNYSEILKSIQKILVNNDFELPIISESNKTSQETSDEEVPIEVLNPPTKDPSNFYKGYKMISENDGKTYEIKITGKGSNKKKIWILSKESLVIHEKTIEAELPKEKKETIEEISSETSADSLITKKRKAPNELAKNYPEGYELLSTNDNKIYVVKLVGTGTKQFKRWTLKKK